jgi:hypothetical protein
MGTKKGVVKSATPRIHCAVMPPSSVMWTCNSFETLMHYGRKATFIAYCI